MNETVRLAKQVADQFACSRAQAERYIECGWVSVDGRVVEQPGERIQPGQVVALSDEATTADIPPATFLLNKPEGLTTRLDDGVIDAYIALLVAANQVAHGPEGAAAIRRIHFKRLELVTPLETGASGLVVLTQDFRIKRKLVTDASEIEHEYVVSVTGEAAADRDVITQLARSSSGDRKAQAKVSWQSEGQLRFALKTPEKGEIAERCEVAGLTVTGMRRLRIGRLPLAGLAPGQWRYLAGFERF